MNLAKRLALLASLASLAAALVLTQVTDVDSAEPPATLATQYRWSLALPAFAANREFYREFLKIGASGAPEIANSVVVAGLPMQIPYSTEQGIIFAE
jgi:hypothetical protein